MNPDALTIPAPSFLKLLAHDLRWQTLMALAHSDYRVQELVALLQQPGNLVSYHLKRLRNMQLVTERRSAADRRDVYYSIDLDRLRELYFASGATLHPALNGATEASPTPSEHATVAPSRAPVRVLFLCTRNSARSQMAEGIMHHLGGRMVAVYSAGSDPATVHPDAVRVMAAMGMDISAQHSKHLNEFRAQTFDYIVTVCDRAREACPLFPNDPVQIHWSFADPAAVEPEAERYQAFWRTAQELTTRIRYLLALMENEGRTQAAADGAVQS